ncbi:CPBP family intramembrane metalloprotease [Halobacterium salinarum]|uniref:CPBP family intramembrane glutamic endopeptidase n=2 Tax=Halobacterium salinarum TaxID=2242 RepID=UPI001F3B67D4|nr:CPBP family intramembrane glutamic endopeptidase [Halobacterium salinarum]MCF2206501.1 CPBP family intramembrane metalloprotease [Halobacterium salinarum]
MPTPPVSDRYASTVGFVVAGVGLAATLLDWAPATDAVAHTATACAAVATLAFAGRRHGTGPAWLSGVGTGAGGALSLTAAAALLSMTGPVTAGPAVALFAGIGVIGAGLAAVAGVGADGVRARERAVGVAVVVSAGALVASSLLAAIAAGIAPDAPTVAYPVRAAVSSVGLGIMGVAFVRASDVAGIDTPTVTRRDVGVAAGGVGAIFALHLGLNVVVTALSLPQTQHGLIEAARKTPAMLVPLAVVSLVFVAPGEELLARNAVQKYLYDAYSRRSAVVVASFVFAASHLLAYAGTAAPGAVMVALARVFVVSLVLGVAYERTDNLLAPIVIHGVYDAVQFGLAYWQFT